MPKEKEKGTVRMEQNQTIISLKGITKTFSTRNGTVEALKGIDLDIKRGEIFGIIGLSGAGKSTLVRCINLLERPDGGSVVINDTDLMSLSASGLREKRREIGMIFQQFHLLMQKTALENVCFPMEIAKVPKADAKKRAEELLEMVGLADRMYSYPAQLSGGQKQRVAIARALAMSPQVLLCDEATSALDPNTTKGVLELLKEINRKMGITVIIITHEMKVIREICHRVAIISDGAIAELGKVEEVFRAPKTDAGRALVFHEGDSREGYDGPMERCYRIVFDESNSNEPLLGSMMIECGAPVNILAANTRSIEGKVYGQMLIQLPKDAALREKMIANLRAKDILVEEVDHV